MKVKTVHFLFLKLEEWHICAFVSTTAKPYKWERQTEMLSSQRQLFLHPLPFWPGSQKWDRMSAPLRLHALLALKALPICNGRRICGQSHPVLCQGRQPRFLERVLRKCLRLFLMENFAATSLLCLKRLPHFSCVYVRVCVLFKVFAHIFISKSLKSHTQKSDRAECLLFNRCFLVLQTCISYILSHQLRFYLSYYLPTWLPYLCFWGKFQVWGFWCLFFLICI